MFLPPAAWCIHLHFPHPRTARWRRNANLCSLLETRKKQQEEVEGVATDDKSRLAGETLKTTPSVSSSLEKVWHSRRGRRMVEEGGLGRRVQTSWARLLLAYLNLHGTRREEVIKINIWRQLLLQGCRSHSLLFTVTLATPTTPLSLPLQKILFAVSGKKKIPQWRQFQGFMPRWRVPFSFTREDYRANYELPWRSKLIRK